MASEVDQITEAIQSGNHFVLSGGAGSGKTHTLIELIRRVLEINSKARIACITYTNVAADEISERVQSDFIHASTIHDFLWDNIGGFQTDLEEAILNLYDGVSEFDLNEVKGIQYRDFKSLKKGIISHKEVIEIATYLFQNCPLLPKIISDKYDYIFVDEYQDTFEEVIKILTDHLNRKEFDLIIGFFGDIMQSIYDEGGREIDESLINDSEQQRGITKIEKQLNRRNPQTIIDLANIIRSDGLRQEAAKNSKAPNNDSDGEIKTGDVKFLYSVSGNKKLEDVTESEFCSNWDFSSFDDNDKPISKVLLLRNEDIARYGGFINLFEIYEKDKIVGRSGFLKRIKDYIQNISIEIDLSELSFLELLDYLVQQISEELDFKSSIAQVQTEIPNFPTLQRAINKVKRDYPGIDKVLPTRGMLEFIWDNDELFEIALNTPYSELKRTFISKDKLIGKKASKNEKSNQRNDEKDPLMKHLYAAQKLLFQYEKDEIPDLIRSVDFPIVFGRDKQLLKSKMDDLLTTSSQSIKEVLDFVESSGLIVRNEKVNEYFSYNAYLLQRVGSVSFSEVSNLYCFTEGLTPYSTQHGVKGDEFNNVLVAISNYKSSPLSISYEFLFENKMSEERYYQRTRNLFYVAVTRAKENLIVFFDGECSQAVIEQARGWFGENNVINLDQ